MRTRVLCAAASLMSFLLVNPLGAVTLEVQPVIRSLLNADATPIDPAVIARLDPDTGVSVEPGSGPFLVDVDYYVRISNLLGPPAQIGFGNVAFDIAQTGLEPSPFAPGWLPDLSLVDTNGDLPLGEEPKWTDNGDYGPLGTDLIDVVVGVAPRSFGDMGVDPRWELAQVTPELMGTTQFLWTPSATASRVGVDIVAFSTYNTELFLRRTFGQRVTGSLVFQEYVPVAGDTDRDGDVDLDDLNNVRNFFGETGNPVTGDTAPFDGVVDENDLNAVRNNFGAGGNGFATPEPGSVGLATLGALGSMIVLRRFIVRVTPAIRAPRRPW